MTITYRTQNDGLNDDMSALTTVSCAGSRDRTRQEWKRDTDINTVIQKFGLPANGGTRDPIYTTVDYTLDLQAAMNATAITKRAYANTPAEVRAKYPTLSQWLAALYAGDLGFTNTKPQPAPTTTESSSTSNTTT